MKDLGLEPLRGPTSGAGDRPVLPSAVFPGTDYDLAATLDSGQAFRWEHDEGAWTGVIGERWVRLRQDQESLQAETAVDPGDWSWLRHYLQIDVELGGILRAFPPDAPLTAAVDACRGLRLLRQDPWECLASFVLSSTKQILQIRQGVGRLASRFGQAVVVPPGVPAHFRFPAAETLAGATETALRGCGIGFRAPYLRAIACAVASGELRLDGLGALPLAAARERLMELPGVGRKIADCVLLFAYDFPAAFPVDVWVLRALKELYFPRRNPSPRELRAFSETHFGAQGGYAQQYLFHHTRMRAGRVRRPAPGSNRGFPC